MRSVFRTLLVASCIATVAVFASSCSKAEINKALGRYRAYDEKLNGKQQIADAVARAKTAQKRVLVQFGGNWCVFCEALDKLIDATPELAALRSRYIAIHVDAGANPDLNTQYGKPFDLGFPVLLVLDGDGKLLHTQASTAFQRRDAMGHDAAGVGAFLKAWVE